MRDQEPVERAAVRQREVGDPGGVMGADWQFHEPACPRLWCNQFRPDSEVGSSEAAFDGDLPYAGSAEEHVVVRALDNLARELVQTFRPLQHSEEDIRIEKQAH